MHDRNSVINVEIKNKKDKLLLDIHLVLLRFTLAKFVNYIHKGYANNATHF